MRLKIIILTTLAGTAQKEIIENEFMSETDNKKCGDVAEETSYRIISGAVYLLRYCEMDKDYRFGTPCKKCRNRKKIKDEKNKKNK